MAEATDWSASEGNSQDKPVPKKELDEAKTQLKRKLLLSQESTSNRMMHLAKSELYFGRFVTLDELVENIDSVTAERIRKFAADFFIEDNFLEAILLPRE